MRSTTQNEVFVASSDQDRKWANCFQKVLAPLVQGGGVSLWSTQTIRPGMEPDQEIRNAISRAKIALLLVGADLLDSTFAERELPLLLQAADRREVHILWGLTTDCLYHETGLEKYKPAWAPETPLDAMQKSKANGVVASVCREIAELCEPPTVAPPKEPVVFLAETTDELHDARRQFVSFLEQENICVLPDGPSYRDADRELPEMLKQAVAVVQLHHKIAIPSEPAFSDGIEIWLKEQAQKAGKIPGETLLRWRPAEIVEEDVSNEAHRRFVFAPDTIPCDLGNFKRIVVQ